VLQPDHIICSAVVGLKPQEGALARSLPFACSCNFVFLEDTSVQLCIVAHIAYARLRPATTQPGKLDAECCGHIQKSPSI